MLYSAVMDEPVGGPSTRRWPRRHRWVAVGIAALAAVTLVTVWVAQRWGNSTTPVDVDEVLAGFVTSTSDPPSTSTTSGAPVGSSVVTTVDPVEATVGSQGPTTTVAVAPAMPAVGVYRVASSGSEGIDVLDKPTHSYPAESALVVTATPCGRRFEWMPLEERREWFEVCLDGGGVRLTRYGGFHTFYGQDDERSQECGDDAWLVPPGGVLGTMSSVTCAGSGIVDERTVTVMRRDAVVLDGVSVPVTVVRTVVVGTGSTRGDSSRELWLTDDGLPMVWIDDVTGLSDSAVGMVNYREQMELRLVSLEPL